MDNKLLLPALRSQMGDWIYYISRMRMQDIAERVSFAEEIHKKKELNELLQRQVSNRKKYIVRYLETQDQRFFNSIIIGVYKSSPDWLELEVGENRNFSPDDIPDYAKTGLGFLMLSGKEKLFAIDGQHRVAAIRDAVKHDDFSNEEVSVIFVAAKMDQAGKQRTRRLFSTLNRYAKQVKRSYIIALNEDDAIAIITRKLIEDHPFFAKANVYLESKNLRRDDFDNFTSVEALYDSLDVYLCNMRSTTWEKYKSIYPGDDDIAKYYRDAKKVWDQLIKALPALSDLQKAPNSKKIIKKYRGDHGGNLIYRPIGLIMLFQAIRMAKDSGLSLNVTLKRIAKVTLDLSDNPWSNLLWDIKRKRMYPYIGKEKQSLGSMLIFYMIKGDLQSINHTNKSLLELYKRVLDWDEDKHGELLLPSKISS